MDKLSKETMRIVLENISLDEYDEIMRDVMSNIASSREYIDEKVIEELVYLGMNDDQVEKCYENNKEWNRISYEEQRIEEIVDERKG